MAAERGHTHKSFLETFRPLHIITRLIGINQFHLPRNYHQSGQILLKRSSLLPFVAQVIMCFGIVILQIVFKLTEVSMSSQFVSMLSSLSALQLISMDLMNRKKIGLIISGLHDIDCMMVRMGTIPMYNDKWRPTLAIIATFLLTFVATCLQCYSLQMHINKTVFSTMASGYLALFISLTACTIFTTYLCFAFGVLKRYRATNEHLRRMFRLAGASGTLVHSKLTADAMVNNCAKIHQKLREILGWINRCYSMPIMQFLLAQYVFSLVTMNYLCGVLILDRVEDIPKTLGGAIWTIYFAFFALFTAHVGSNLTEEFENTAFVIVKCLHESKEEKTNNQLQRFMQQLKHIKPALTCSLFTFDWNMIYMAFSSGFAYLLMFIQFDILALTLTNGAAQISHHLSLNESIKSISP